MKKLYLLILLITPFCSNAQDDSFRIQGTSGIMNSSSFGVEPFIGLQLDYGFTEHFGLQTHFELGDGYLFSSANLITAPLALALLSDGNYDNDGTSLAFLLTSFESMAFYIPADDDLEISVELSLFGIYILENETDVFDEEISPDIFFGGRYGISLNFTPGDHFIASMHANIRKLYGMRFSEGWGYGINLGVGFRF